MSHYHDLIKRRATVKAWRIRNKDKVNAYNRQWMLENPEKREQYNKRNRNRIKCYISV